MIQEHCLVALTRNFTEHHLEQGDIGTVVHCYADGGAFEVEFMRDGGETALVVTVELHEIRGVCSDDVLYARGIAA